MEVEDLEGFSHLRHLLRRIDEGYRCFWHAPTLYNPHNVFRRAVNVFGAKTVSKNVVCLPPSRRGGAREGALEGVLEGLRSLGVRDELED